MPSRNERMWNDCAVARARTWSVVETACVQVQCEVKVKVVGFGRVRDLCDVGNIGNC